MRPQTGVIHQQPLDRQPWALTVAVHRDGGPRGRREPDPRLTAAYGESYEKWRGILDSYLEQT